ncbi:hypothetical protein FA15DRAFT_738259, partial [Coprinopsis marcescibilis]
VAAGNASSVLEIRRAKSTTKGQFPDAEPPDSELFPIEPPTTTVDPTSEDFVFITSLTELALLSPPPRPSRSAPSSPSKPIPRTTPPPPLTNGDTDTPSSAATLPPQVPNPFSFSTTILRSPDGTTTSIIIILDTPTPKNGRPSSKPLPVGPIIGGSIGALALLQILILILLFAWRRRKRGSALAVALSFPWGRPQADDGGFGGLARAFGIRRRSNFKASSGRAGDYAILPPAVPFRKGYTQRTGYLDNEAMAGAPAREGNTVPDGLPANSGTGFTPGSSGRPDGWLEDGNEALKERIRFLQQQVASLRARDARPASTSTSAEEPPPMYSSNV